MFCWADHKVGCMASLNHGMANPSAITPAGQSVPSRGCMFFNVGITKQRDKELFLTLVAHIYIFYEAYIAEVEERGDLAGLARHFKISASSSASVSS